MKRVSTGSDLLLAIGTPVATALGTDKKRKIKRLPENLVFRQSFYYAEYPEGIINAVRIIRRLWNSIEVQRCVSA